VGSGEAAMRLAELVRGETARQAEAMPDRERVGRMERACARVADLAARSFADVRVDPLSGKASCPELDALLGGEDRARPDYDEGLWNRAARGIEAAGFRLRLASAAKLRRLERDAGRRALPGDPPPDGMVIWQDREVLVLARRNMGRRLDAALHELAHLADEVALDLGAARDFWLCGFCDKDEAALKEATRLWWDRELVADMVAAAMADAAGLRLGPRMRQFLGTIHTAREELTGRMAASPFARALWRLGGGVGGVLVPVPVDEPREQPAAWAAKTLDRIAPRALRAAVTAELLMANAQSGAAVQ